MARGFRGMKDDFMEIISHIIGLSCCSIAHDDRDEGLLLPLPKPNVGDFAYVEASLVLSASNTEVRDAAATEDASRSALACTAHVDDGIGTSVPQAESVVIDEGLDPGFAAVRNTLCPTFESEENFWRGCNPSLNIKLYKKDSESLPSSQIEKERRNLSSRSLNFSNELEEEQGTSKETSFESASDVEDYHLHYEKEGEDFSIQEHILVEDHMPFISPSEGLQLRKRTNKNLDDDDDDIREYHEADGFDFVIV